MSLKSILFVPATRPDLLTKACSGMASAICIDLEDAVAPNAKVEARAFLAEAIAQVMATGKKCLVRVNSEDELLSDDLASITNDLDFVVLPKAGSAGQINGLAAVLDHQFPNGGPDILCLVESGADLDRLRKSSDDMDDRVKGFALGTEDLAADFSTHPNSPIVVHCFHELAILCRRWGLQLLGYPGTIAEFGELGKFKLKVDLGAEAGASGGFAIHPKQIEVLNAVFTPSEKQVEQALNIVDAFERVMESGEGVCSLDGKMIDRPVYLNAKQVLLRS